MDFFVALFRWDGPCTNHPWFWGGGQHGHYSKWHGSIFPVSKYSKSSSGSLVGFAFCSWIWSLWLFCCRCILCQPYIELNGSWFQFSSVLAASTQIHSSHAFFLPPNHKLVARYLRLLHKSCLVILVVCIYYFIVHLYLIQGLFTLEYSSHCIQKKLLGHK